jgi:WD40 repeat protein
MITGGADGTVFLWNVETGQPARKMGESRPTPGHDNRVTALCFSADGRTALSGGGYGSATVTQWDLETGKAIWSIPTKLTNHGGWMSVGASPTSLQAATGHDNSLRLWRMKSPVANPQVLEGHKGPVRSPTFSPDGRWLASADDAGLVLLWNAESGKKLREWQLPGPVHAVTFAHDGRHLATANGNGTVYILRIGTPPGS